MKHSLVFVTASSLEEARKLQEALVKERLAACVKILPGVESCYTWKGKVEKAEEVLLLAETKSALLEKLFARVKELHSYEEPAIAAIPMDGCKGFLKWVDEVTK